MERNGIIDTVKGLGMLILLVHHVAWIAIDRFGVQNAFFEAFHFYRQFIYMPYFMTIFFICSGMCTNFDKDFKDIISSTIKVIIPCYILLRYEHWFIDCYILSRLGYWLVYQYIHNDKFKLLVCILCGLIAVILHKGDQGLNEFYSWHHALAMLLFIHIGNKYQYYFFSTPISIISSFCYVALACAMCYWFKDIPFSSIDLM